MLQAAIREMRTKVFRRVDRGDRSTVPNVGVLVSDGYSTVNASRTLPEARLAKADGITMLSVIVNADHNQQDMTAISTDPSRDLFLLTDASLLDQVVQQALGRLCNG